MCARGNARDVPPEVHLRIKLTLSSPSPRDSRRLHQCLRLQQAPRVRRGGRRPFSARPRPTLSRRRRKRAQHVARASGGQGLQLCRIVRRNVVPCCNSTQGMADMRWTPYGTGCVGRSNVASASARERSRREGHTALGGGWPYRMLHCMHISESERAAQPRSFNDDCMLQPHGHRLHDHARWRSLCEFSPDWCCRRCRRCGCSREMRCATEGDDYLC
jgi:hypothetical protein